MPSRAPGWKGRTPRPFRPRPQCFSASRVAFETHEASYILSNGSRSGQNEKTRKHEKVRPPSPEVMLPVSCRGLALVVPS